MEFNPNGLQFHPTAKSPVYKFYSCRTIVILKKKKNWTKKNSWSNDTLFLDENSAAGTEKLFDVFYHGSFLSEIAIRKW